MRFPEGYATMVRGKRPYGARRPRWPGLAVCQRRMLAFCVNEFVLEMGLQVCKVNRMPFLRAVVYTFILSTWHLRQPGSNVGISPRLSM